MAHRYLAALFALPLAWLVVELWRVKKQVAWAAWIAAATIALYGFQVMVGAFNVWFEFPDTLTVGHTVIAAALWLTLTAGAALGLLEPGVQTLYSRARKVATA